MFQFFKSRRLSKTASHIAQLFYSALFRLLDTDIQRLPDKLRDDVFVLAYIHGVIGFVSITSHINDRRQRGLLVIEVFEKLFPSHGLEITEKCNQFVMKKDKLFLSTLEIARNEIEVAYKSSGFGKLPSLIEYIEKNYE